MAGSLLTTKLYFPPVRRDYIPRPRLVERLVTGLRGPLTLVSAPAGYGKTTLLSEWRAGQGRDVPAAWLSLDANDGDPVLWLRYLVAALGSLQARLVDETAPLLESSPLPPTDAILISLVNELSACPGDIALILDDYHVLTSPEIHDTMAFLLDRAPPQMHTVILTREDPPLPLSRLRARGQVVEIRESDLRFSSQEAAAFLAQTMGLALSQDAVASLVTRTEGWAAGLQMAGLSLHKEDELSAFAAAFQGQDRYVMDYLMDEVFGQQSGQVQAFLLQTSVLERMCAPLCDAVLADAFPHSSQQTLEYLERANLFVVPLDNRREWYRYHHLFADLLRYRLQRESPSLVPDLHRRACRWYARAESPDEAMRHALAALDHDLAADLAERYMLRMIGSSRLGAYLAWIEPLPEALVHSRAYLCAGCGWAYLFTHRLDLAIRYVERGEAALSLYEPVCNSSDGRRISREEVRGHLAAIRGYALRESGDLAGAIEQARQAQEALPPEALSIRCVVALTLGELHEVRGEIVEARRALGEAVKLADMSRENPYVALGATAALGSIALRQGRLNEAEELFERAIGYGTSASGALLPVPAARLVHGWLALLHTQRNEIDAAQGHLDRVLEAAAQKDDPQATIRVYLYQSLLDQCRGALDSAETWLQRAEQGMRDHTPRDGIQTEWIVFRCRLYLARGEAGAAARLLAAQGVQATDLDGPRPPSRVQGHQPEERLQRYLLLAHVLLAEGAPDRASDLLDKIGALAQDHPDVAVSLEASSLRASIAYAYQGDAARACVCLERALDLAAPEGYVRPFLNVGPLLATPLRQAVKQGIHPAYAQRLLAALDDQERRLGAVRRPVAGAERDVPATPALIEPLTRRERQVLRLLAAGLTSTEVAEELVIAVSTSRSYIKNLYNKLDAHSRDEAVELGYRYGLIR